MYHIEATLAYYKLYIILFYYKARMTAYSKPGPPTPVHGKAGRGTPKIQKSPKTPGSGRRRFRNNKNKTPKKGETTPTPSKKVQIYNGLLLYIIL